MTPLHPAPHRRLRFSDPLAIAVSMAALAASCAATAATAAPDPVAGRALYLSTAAASGHPGLSSCTDCHGAVQSRRARIAGSAYAEITQDKAMAAFAQAVMEQPPMAQFREALSATQAQDIAAYLGDTPRTSAAALDFAPAALDMPDAQPIDLLQALATDATLEVRSVSLTGPDAADFALDADACSAQTLRAGGTCRVTVSFRAADTAGKRATLSFDLQPSDAGMPFQREVALSGAVVVTSVPPPSTSGAGGNGESNGEGSGEGSGEGTGGGALGGAWLLGLLAALAAACRVRRISSPPAE